jgi:PAS domain S-box-containing protein
MTTLRINLRKMNIFYLNNIINNYLNYNLSLNRFFSPGVLKFFVWFLLFNSLFTTLFAVEFQPETGNKITSDTIVIASEPDYPPYCFVNETGKADGFSVELFNAAAQAAGLEVKIKIGIWNQIRQDLADGKIDALPLVGRTPEREDKYDFSMPYLSLHGAVFVRRNESGIQSLEDLKEKEIVVMKGDNAEEFVRRENISEKIFTTNTFEEAFRELEAGRFDAVIMQRITGLKLLEEMKVKSIKALDLQMPEFRQDFCFAVQKGNHDLLNRLNEGLSIVIANNTFEKLRFKWLGPVQGDMISREAMIRRILIFLIPTVVLGIILWIVFLRKEVRKRTAKLNDEIAHHKKTLEALKKQQNLLKESEAQIRLLLDSTAEGIYGIDINGNCTLINQAALVALGYTAQKQVMGKNMHKLIHHTKPDGTRCRLEECRIYKAFREGIGIHSADEIFWRSDDTGFPAEYFSFPIRQKGIITGSVVTFWDITERKKAEKELIQFKNELEEKVILRTAELDEKVKKLDRNQKAMLYMVEDLNSITSELKNERRKLEAANKELEAFTYSVSHDLRAPLRAINGFSKFLEEDYAGKLDEEGKRFLGTIRENAAKMDQLISDLLNLSRVSRASINLSEIDMEKLVRAVYNDTASMEEHNTFQFIVRTMPMVNCDSNLMKQVWQNLIGNALKYSSKSKTKKIEIGAAKNNNEITYFIKDQGTGFNNNYRHKLFGVFQRLHHDHEFEGTGVGLAIVQRIVQLHGGQVWAEGEENKGAAFYFSLPVINKQ